MLWILASVAFALLCYEVPTLITAVLWPLWNNPNALQTDFHYYYEAARRFSANPQALYGLSDHVIAGFAYPPPAIVPFLALARWPLGAALVTLTLASYGVLVITIRQWCGHLRAHGFVIDRRMLSAVMLIALALGPTYMNAIFGQVNVFVLATSVAFVCLLNVPIAAGGLLAVGIWLKVYPALLAVVALWERRAWRALAWASVAGVVIAVVLWPLLPLETYRTFISAVLPSRIDKTAIHISNQSLAAFLERFRHPPELFLNWTGQQAVTVSGTVRVINTVLALIGVGYWWRRYGLHDARPIAAAGVIAMVAVVAPLGWGHTYVMVLPLIVIHLVAPKARPVSAVVALCVMAFMIPAGRHLPFDWAPGWFQNVVYSRYLIATIVLALIPVSNASRSRGRDTSRLPSHPPPPAR